MVISWLVRWLAGVLALPTLIWRCGLWHAPCSGRPVAEAKFPGMERFVLEREVLFPVLTECRVASGAGLGPATAPHASAQACRVLNLCPAGQMGVQAGSSSPQRQLACT